MTPHLRLKGPEFCQTLYQHTLFKLLSCVSVQLLLSATSRYTLLKMRILAFFTYKLYNTLNKITMIIRINGQAQSS